MAADMYGEHFVILDYRAQIRRLADGGSNPPFATKFKAPIRGPFLFAAYIIYFSYLCGINSKY